MGLRVFIFGAGYSGRAIAASLREQAAWIGGTSRTEKRFSELEAVGIEPFVFDGKEIGPSLRKALSGATHLIQSIAPDAEGDPVLNACAGHLDDLMPALRWAGYLSTVGVYGNHDGAWVDELTDCRPVSRRSLWRRDAEEAWEGLSERLDLPVSILRLSGIYGPGRNVLIKLRDGTARRLVKPGQVFNRIHVDDIAGATKHLLEKEAYGIWNVTDDEPAPPQEVVSFAADLMGVQPPDEIDFETADLSPMARSFYGENKRVSNAKLKASGYDFRYPNYEAALTALLETEIKRN